MIDWRNCAHGFVRFFGPVLKCRKCGATTMVTMDPEESKPIHAPAYLDEIDDSEEQNQ